MEKIQVRIEWSGKNYGCIADNPALGGIIVVTNKTLAGLKNDFCESLLFHIEGCIKSGDVLPDWLLSGDYELDYVLEISALLHSLDGIITRSAIARVSGINERQIGHYASGVRTPRPEQRRRIIDGIHQSVANCYLLYKFPHVSLSCRNKASERRFRQALSLFNI